MAIQPEQFSKFRTVLEDIIEWAPIKATNRDFIQNEVFEEVFAELERVIDESRPPRMYVFGRAGAGKSSLINALANKDDVADVGSIEPTTVESKLYEVSFPERHSHWEVVDSRGLFEAVAPDGGLPADTVEFMRQDLQEYQPDVLIHVMTPGQVRSGKDDFDVLDQLRDEFGGLPPIVYCLNKIDTHMSPGDDWPPEKNASLSGEITRNLDFLSSVLSEDEVHRFSRNEPYRGCQFDSENHIGIVPLFLKDQERCWNIETLSILIGDFLPDDAQLQFFQAQRRDNLMRRFSRRFTQVFSSAATGIGITPLPVADMLVLTPLQLLLVAVIGGLSCREFGLSAVREYVGAIGGTAVTGLAARELARSLVQFLPGVGTGISAAVAGGTTWAIGKSAEAYFFDDDINEPKYLLKEGKKMFGRD